MSKEQRKKLFLADPNYALLQATEALVEKMDESITELKNVKPLRIEGIAQIKGDKGVKPTKGVDYFTSEEITQFKEEVTPVKGIEYFTQEEIDNIVKESAKIATPIKGKDYFDGKDSIIPGPQGKEGKPGTPGANGSSDTAKEIAIKINTLKGEISYEVLKNIPDQITIDQLLKELKNPKSKHRLKPKDIEGMPLDMSDLRWHGGGISAIQAGSGITITEYETGKFEISATAISENYKNKVSATDTTPDYLFPKLVAGTNVTLTKQNTGGNENIKIDATDTGMINPMTQAGDLIKGGAAGVPERLAIGTANQVLHGGTSVPSYSPVVEADISLTDITTNDSTTLKHGFLDKLPGGTLLYKRADGAWSTPSAVTVPNGYIQEAFAYTANTEHTITHNFGTYPVVQAFDDQATPNMVIPVIIRNIDLNTIGITFSITDTFTIVLTVGSPPFSTITIVSDDYTVNGSDYLIKETGAGKFITLPTAVGRSGKIFIVKNSSAGICDVIFTSGQNADGYTDVTIATGDAYSFMSDNSNYLVF